MRRRVYARSVDALTTSLLVCSLDGGRARPHAFLVRRITLIRLKQLFDGGVFEEIKYPAGFSDPLGFKDSKTYKERFNLAKSKTGLDDTFLIGSGKING